MNPMADNPVIVPDRDLEGEKDPGTPRIRCPLCGWSPRKEDRWFCTCWNSFDTWRRLPRLHTPVGLKPSASLAADGRRIRIGIVNYGCVVAMPSGCVWAFIHHVNASWMSLFSMSASWGRQMWRTLPTWPAERPSPIMASRTSLSRSTCRSKRSRRNKLRAGICVRTQCSSSQPNGS